MRLSAIVSVVLVSACGVPAQDSFDRADPVDFDVDPPAVVDSTVPAADETPVLPVRAHFVAEGGIVATGPTLDSFESVLTALHTRPEDGSGLRTAVNADAVLTLTSAAPGSVTVELTEAFQALPAEEQRLAVAQLVLTVTDRSPGVRVGFVLGGAPVDVPTADSTVGIGGSVSRSDYVTLLAST